MQSAFASGSWILPVLIGLDAAVNGFMFPFALHADWLGLPNRVFEYLVSEADPGFDLDCLLVFLELV